MLFSGDLQYVDPSTKALYTSLAFRDRDTAKHCLSVARLCELMATDLNLPDTLDYFVGGLLHDIGKLSMPDSVLKSSDVLTSKQRESLVDHVIAGEELLSSLGYNSLILDITKYHHERIDGSGYLKLKGDTIPLSAKIAGIVDSYDAMMSSRKYARKVLTPSEALDILHGCDHQYDRYLLGRFSNLILSSHRIENVSVRNA